MSENPQPFDMLFPNVTISHVACSLNNTPAEITFHGDIHISIGEPPQAEQEESEAYTPPIDIKPTVTPIKTEPPSIYTIQQQPIMREEDALLIEDSDSEETFPLPPADPYAQYRNDPNAAHYRYAELRAMKVSLSHEWWKVSNELNKMSNRNTPLAIAKIQYLVDLKKQYDEVKHEYEIIKSICKQD